MISLGNKKLEKQKTSLLCKIHKSKVSRNGKKKINMTKAEYLKNKENPLIRLRPKKEKAREPVV